MARSGCSGPMYLVAIWPHGCGWAEEVVDVSEDDLSGQAVAWEPILLFCGHWEINDGYDRRQKQKEYVRETGLRAGIDRGHSPERGDLVTIVEIFGLFLCSSSFTSRDYAWGINNWPDPLSPRPRLLVSGNE